MITVFSPFYQYFVQLIGAILITAGILLLVGVQQFVAKYLDTDMSEIINNLSQAFRIVDTEILADGETIDFVLLLESVGIPLIVLGVVLLLCSVLACAGACCSSRVILLAVRIVHMFYMYH